MRSTGTQPKQLGNQLQQAIPDGVGTIRPLLWLKGTGYIQTTDDIGLPCNETQTNPCCSHKATPIGRLI